MEKQLVISLDGMGGDHAPRVVIEGAERARRAYPGIRYIIYGDENKIAPWLAKHPALRAVVTLRHTPDVVTSDDKPSVALRQGRASSMRLAIDAVAAGEADGVVSAGNTGALMAMAKFALKLLPGITRPAIAARLPTKARGHEVVMLDLGANVDSDAHGLLEFGVLGGVFSREVLKVAQPRIALLNIGSEAMKGHDTVREAAELFVAARHLPGHYVGFVEGDGISAGRVDVVVADGFTGNVALKSIEGTARLIVSLIRQGFRASWMARAGLLLGLPGLVVALPFLLALKRRIDPRLYNGAAMMGLKGLCVKSHGGTDAVGFANAIGVAAEMARGRFNDKVEDELARLSMPAAAAGELAS